MYVYTNLQGQSPRLYIHIYIYICNSKDKVLVYIYFFIYLFNSKDRVLDYICLVFKRKGPCSRHCLFSKLVTVSCMSWSWLWYLFSRTMYWHTSIAIYVCITRGYIPLQPEPHRHRHFCSHGFIPGHWFMCCQPGVDRIWKCQTHWLKWYIIEMFTFNSSTGGGKVICQYFTMIVHFQLFVVALKSRSLSFPMINALVQPLRIKYPFSS